MQCRKCLEDKPISEFPKHSASKLGIRTYCKNCNYAYSRDWVLRNREHVNEYAREYNYDYKKDPNRQRKLRKTLGEPTRDEKRTYVNEVKAERGCKYCAEHDYVCLDFHHRDPLQKLFSIGKTANSCFTFQEIKTEIEKCDVVCSNCHRKIHAGRSLLERIF